MNKHLGTLIGLGLDLELFYTLSVSKWEVSLQGYNTEDLANYLISMGFIKYDYLYEDTTVMSLMEELNLNSMEIKVLLNQLHVEKFVTIKEGINHKLIFLR